MPTQTQTDTTSLTRRYQAALDHAFRRGEFTVDEVEFVDGWTTIEVSASPRRGWTVEVGLVGGPAATAAEVVDELCSMFEGDADAAHDDRCTRRAEGGGL